MRVSTDLLYIRPHALTVHSNMITCDIVGKAIERYESIFFPPTFDMRSVPADANNILERLTLNVDGSQPVCEKHIELNSNEACTHMSSTIRFARCSLIVKII
jgi:hypothetical protein